MGPLHRWQFLPGTWLSVGTPYGAQIFLRIHPPALMWVLSWAEVSAPPGSSPQAAGKYPVHHSHFQNFHGVQGNPCSCNWSTSSLYFFTDLVVHKLVFPHSLAVFCLFLKTFSQRHSTHGYWAQSCLVELARTLLSPKDWSFHWQIFSMQTRPKWNHGWITKDLEK